MLKHPKAKGTRFENEVVKKFKDAGYPDTERMWGSNGESRGLPKEVDVQVLKWPADNCEIPFWIQCKSVARLSEKFKPTDKIHATVFKENRGKMYIMLDLDAFIKRFL